MFENLKPFYKLLTAEVPIDVTSELKETFDLVKKTLINASEVALKQSIPEKELVLMRNASSKSAG